MTTKIIMGGAAGRMGQMILRCALEDDGFEILGGLEQEDHPATGQTVGALIGAADVQAPVRANLDAITDAEKGVTIHFSSPEATLAGMAWSVQHLAPVVIGTTGFNPDQRVMINEAAREIPIVFAPNMSVGVNTLFKIVGDVTRILGENYDIEITEMHHRFKKDAPSGTARRLGEVAAEARGSSYEEMVVDGRSGMIGERPQKEIGMHALRGGDVVGEHTVSFTTLGERLELTHKAHSRETFARGALRAAEWLLDKEPGLYDMQAVLGLE